MSDNILKPGKPENESCSKPDITIDYEGCLKKDNNLSELSETAEIARRNLDVYGTDEVYTKTELSDQVSTKTREILNEHIDDPDAHGIQSKINEITKDILRSDGSTPFTKPQRGKTPTEDNHLATKNYVDDLQKEHIKSEDPHNVMKLVKKELLNYLLKDEALNEDDYYTKSDIVTKLSNYILSDGSRSFTKPISGRNPILDSHLSTKLYVDTEVEKHNVAEDPHGFRKLLLVTLSKYALKDSVYNKDQTYNRDYIDNKISEIVSNVTTKYLNNHLSEEDPHDIISIVKEMMEDVVFSDGSVPFTKAQKGVKGTNKDHLITKEQLDDSISSFKQNLNDSVKWVTSGPVDITVGYVDENEVLPEELTLQEIMDAIFYGRAVNVTSPQYGVVNQKVDVEMSIHGSMGLLDYVELYQNDELLGTYTKDDFIDSKLIIESNNITENTIFKMEAHYTNGVIAESTSKTLISFGVFTGIIPKFKHSNTVSYQYLLNKVDADPINNILHLNGPDYKELTHKYKFNNLEEEQQFIVVVPDTYPELYSMKTTSQEFTSDAFRKVEKVPFEIDGIDGVVLHTIYTYYLPVISFNSEVTYKFNN